MPPEDYRRKLQAYQPSPWVFHFMEGRAKLERKITLAAARKSFQNRYTAEFIPSWSQTEKSKYGFQAPQFHSDLEWWLLTRFPGEDGNNSRHFCFPYVQTWPLGSSLLKTPYQK